MHEIKRVARKNVPDFLFIAPNKTKINFITAAVLNKQTNLKCLASPTTEIELGPKF